MPALRVLHFPDWRGANPYQQLLADGLTARGVDVRFATYHGALFPLWRNVLRHRPDILHLHWIADLLGADERRALKYVLKQLVFRLDVALAGWVLPHGVVWTVHNLTSHENHRPSGDLAGRRHLAQRVKTLIVHCQAAVAAVSRAYGVDAHRIRVVAQGSYVAVYANQAGRVESRRRLGIPEDRFVFLHLGSLRPYKGVEELLRSFEELQHPRKHLVIAGQCADAAYLERLRAQAIASKVQIVPGFIPPTDLQYFFNTADAVVLPFREVLMSGSLLLAMGFGRMVVAPSIGCIPDHADTIGSVIYDPDQEGALAAALAEAMTRDPEACGRHNRERVMTFDWNVMAAQTAALYRETMGAAR